MTKTLGLPEIEFQVKALVAQIIIATEDERLASQHTSQLRGLLEELQRTCPHPECKEETVQDCAEFKTRRFCTTCGAQVPR